MRSISVMKLSSCDSISGCCCLKLATSCCTSADAVSSAQAAVSLNCKHAAGAMAALQ